MKFYFCSYREVPPRSEVGGGLGSNRGPQKRQIVRWDFLKKGLDVLDARLYNIDMLCVTLLLSLAQTTAYEAIEAKDGAICADAFQDAIEVNIRP